jgi:hypothetical protein
MKNPCNVVLLPTQNPSRIIRNISDNKLSYGKEIGQKFIRFGEEAAHIYILSGDKIKDKDWCMLATKEIFQCDDSIIELSAKFLNANKHASKIIISTDTSLGLPQPLPEFIQKFIDSYNKGEVLTQVLVDYECPQCKEWGWVNDCREDCNQLFIRPKVDANNCISISLIKDSFSKEEFVTFTYWLRTTEFNIEGYSPEDCLDKWIEETY